MPADAHTDQKLPMHTAIEPEKTREAALLGLKIIRWMYGELAHTIVKVLNKHGRLNFFELVQQVQEVRAKDLQQESSGERRPLEWEQKEREEQVRNGRGANKRGRREDRMVREREHNRSLLMSKEEVAASVMSLLRMGSVVANEWINPGIQGRKEGKAEVLFELDMPRTLNLLRVPLIHAVMETTVKRSSVREVRLVMRVLVRHGRLTLEQLVDASVEELRKEWGKRGDLEDADEAGGDDGGRKGEGGGGGGGGRRTNTYQTSEIDMDGDGDSVQTGLDVEEERLRGDLQRPDDRMNTDDLTGDVRFTEAVKYTNTENIIDRSAVNAQADALLRNMSSDELVERFRDLVNELINKQIVEKAPPAILWPPEDRVHQNAMKKGKAKEKGDGQGEDEVAECENKRHGMLVRELYSFNRFVRKDTWENPNRKPKHSYTEGEKSYATQMTTRTPATDRAVTIEPEHEEWRINFQELNRRVYNCIAVETVRTGLEGVDKLDADICGRVVEAMLYATDSPPPADSSFESIVPLMSRSDPMNIETIRKASEDIHEPHLMLNTAQIRETVKAMLADSRAEERENAMDGRDDRDDDDGDDGDDVRGANFPRIKVEAAAAAADDDRNPSRKRRKAAAEADARIREAAEADSRNQPPTNPQKLPPLSSCLKVHPRDGKPGSKSTTYLFDTPTALNIARTAKLLEIVEQRFGPSGKRVWNMLNTDGQMEQKAISQDSMLGNTRPREILYAMLRNGFVALQDIPRNADRAPSRTFYTWRATTPNAICTTAVMLYKASSNLLQNLQDTLNSESWKDIHKRNEQRMDVDQDTVDEINWKKCTVLDNLLALDQEVALFQLSSGEGAGAGAGGGGIGGGADEAEEDNGDGRDVKRKA